LIVLPSPFKNKLRFLNLGVKLLPHWARRLVCAARSAYTGGARRDRPQSARQRNILLTKEVETEMETSAGNADKLPESTFPDTTASDPLRFLTPHSHLAHVFGNDWFALKAEAFARFFGTPIFLVGQTVVVMAWIAMNVLGPFHFDIYPFILLNLAFSLQAAYAAPLILLAQTRQAQRDKVHTEADAEHREAIAQASEQRQLLAEQHTEQLQFLMNQNTQLTEIIRDLTLNIQALTQDVHNKIVKGSWPGGDKQTV
jgi:uncharacterized membrane protein